MKRILTLIASIAILSTSMNAAEPKPEPSSKMKTAAVAGAGGAVAGVGVWAAIGSGGLLICGTGVAVGIAPFAAAGAVVGLAGYGVYSACSK